MDAVTGKWKPLPRSFYKPAADLVAPRLLGHWLVRRTVRGWCGGPIVETEAYLWDDPACHAAPGMSPRNRVMFGPPGHAYVYFIYGCHYCVNVVCMPNGLAEAVLIRAVEPRVGMDLLQHNRPVKDAGALTDGPGKLCQAMDIGRDLDGADFCDISGPLFIARNLHVTEFRTKHGPVAVTRRIGINKAAELELRFLLVHHRGVSRRHLGK